MKVGRTGIEKWHETGAQMFFFYIGIYSAIWAPQSRFIVTKPKDLALLADPGEAGACSTNTVIIRSF